jgi:hypothetical protein
MRGMTSVCSIVISAQSEALRSPARHLVDHDEGGRGGLRLWSRRVSLRNLEEYPVAGESGPTPPQISRSAYATAVLAPPIPCDRYVSIRTPRGRRRRRPVPWPRTGRTMALLGRARLRNRKRCAGPMWAAIGKLAFRVGRRVRISFAPAESRANFEFQPPGDGP